MNRLEARKATLARAVAGGVWGTAVGDALGLPCEGLSPRRIRALFGGVPNEYRFIPGRGMVSDDTEHTVLVWDALAVSAGEGDAFTWRLAGGLRRWTLALPAGVGLATLRAGVRLVFGVPPSRSGVFSAGNGPAMRAAIIGVACAWDDNCDRLRDLVSRSSRLTHTDPKAEYGALAVAICARCFARGEVTPGIVLAEVAGMLPESGAEELQQWLRRILDSLWHEQPTETFAAEHFPAGVSGYINQTIPVALHAALSHPADFRRAVRSAIACGGDTDTIAAITGGIVGASVGTEGIPEEWRHGIYEPTGVLANIGGRSDDFAGAWLVGVSQTVEPVPYLFALFRNALFAVVVLTHGFRRLLPPYGH
ncbi:MAG: ADP-ribosylglycohydrolase family protein [Akkermansiaceae bacterium]|nr:ADP-ribosylglycohydrolase family protein [Armatimonadota bacterium]